MTKILAVVLVFVCMIAGVVLWPRVVPVGDGPGPGPATRTAPASGPAPASPVGPPAVPSTRPAPTRMMFRMPDGMEVPMLNGVTELPAGNPWPADVPYSRIIGRETGTGGIEWYVHADGSKSTMQMVWRSDLGRVAGVYLVANPRPTLPLVGDGAAKAASQPTGR